MSSPILCNCNQNMLIFANEYQDTMTDITLGIPEKLEGHCELKHFAKYHPQSYPFPGEKNVDLKTHLASWKSLFPTMINVRSVSAGSINQEIFDGICQIPNLESLSI